VFVRRDEQKEGQAETQDSILNRLMNGMYPCVVIAKGCDDPECNCGGNGTQFIQHDCMVG
jgi:hypothetical protein